MNELSLAKKLNQELKSLLSTVKRLDDTALLKRVKDIQKLNQQLLKVIVEKNNEKNAPKGL